ncbi:formate/nitrite transporter family protein [Fonticella tunisiensis]|uniref:Hydrosulfide channel (FNT family) n=1 Tax=Fonticella tunisiensis TaxID=1096341 RepID=A0A4R7KS06_9CLOT|nr:formate/nitrite transporter family protein [Fonticella tunisiensis]TDT62290.1 hydrosulfide channel (FNT family) [Fonticella tunisiensis]
MFKQEIMNVAEAAVKKASILRASVSRYIASSALAGMFVGFGIILIFTIGGLLSPAKVPSTRIVMGVSFGIALSLVLMAGSELFTGNNMIMTIGALEKKVTWMDTIKIWIYSFIGNLIGSFVVAALFTGSGLAEGTTANFVLSAAAAKMSAPFFELFIRGILCNILVCLAVWCFFKLKEETAKLIMIFWCLFAFITAGFEHSVANMTLLSIALLVPHTSAVSVAGFVYNLAAVTLGNIVGGAVFMGFGYWFISKEKMSEF